MTYAEQFRALLSAPVDSDEFKAAMQFMREHHANSPDREEGASGAGDPETEQGRHTDSAVRPTGGTPDGEGT